MKIVLTLDGKFLKQNLAFFFFFFLIFHLYLSDCTFWKQPKKGLLKSVKISPLPKNE